MSLLLRLGVWQLVLVWAQPLVWTATWLADEPLVEVASLGGPVAAGSLPTPTKRIRTIPLQKQYVPISSTNGKMIGYKTAYFGQVFAGGPQRQSFTVVFDTGSGNVILPSTACNSETCMKHQRYDRRSSESAIDIESDGKPIRPGAVERDQVVVSFGTGQVSGDFVQEDVCLSPQAEDCFPLRLVLATDMTSEPFGLFAFDGVLGLGLSALQLQPQFSFMGQMLSSNPGMQPQFAVYLARTEEEESTISFGGHDERMASSEVAWAPVARPELGYWQVNVKAVHINGAALDTCAEGDCYAILDTGTSLLGVPAQASRAMHRMLARPVPETSSTNDASIDCRNVAGATIDFDMGDFRVSLVEEDYSRPEPINMTTGNGSSMLFCRSLLLPVNMKPPMGPKVFIWGEPMLRRYYTVYDVAAKRIGFSLAQESFEQKRSAGNLPALAIDPPPLGSLVAGAPLAARRRSGA